MTHRPSGLVRVVHDLHYFAYGSNLLAKEIERTIPYSRPVGVAFVPGWRLVFTKHSTTRGGDAASIERRPACRLWGFVYCVTQREKTQLERRERGYVETSVSALMVEDVNRCRKVNAIDTFTFVGERACAQRCGPTAAYLKLVLDGASKRQLPVAYREEVARVATLRWSV